MIRDYLDNCRLLKICYINIVTFLLMYLAGGGNVQTSSGRDSEHHRSESSDSFICVSEEPTNGSERGQDRADTESWESVGIQEEKHQVEKEEENSQEEKHQEDKGKEEEPLEEGEKEEKPPEEGKKEIPQAAGDNDSDWESWDD